MVFYSLKFFMGFNHIKEIIFFPNSNYNKINNKWNFVMKRTYLAS